MSFVTLPLLMGVLVIAAEPKRPLLAPRGYELLPNARWLEELERDGGAFLEGLDIVPHRPAFADSEVVPIPIALDALVFESRLIVDSWTDASSLAGGFRFERDPTYAFLYEERYRRMRRLMKYGMWFLPQPRRR